MFVGHFAVGLFAKRLAPKTPLPYLVVCAQLLDILWPLFLLLGLEHARITPGITAFTPLDLYDYPWSHSGLTSLLWSGLAATPWLWRRRWRESMVIAAAVFSHFVLDVVTHRPDMPLAPGADTFWGLGLWSSITGTIVVEGALWIAAVLVYARGTRSTGAFGRWGFWVLVVLLAAIWLSSAFAPPPPSIEAVAYSGLVAVPIFVLWFWRIDRQRPPRTPGPTGAS